MESLGEKTNIPGGKPPLKTNIDIRLTGKKKHKHLNEDLCIYLPSKMLVPKRSIKIEFP